MPSPGDAETFHPGRRLLLLKEGVGDEVRHLEQVLGVGASEGVAPDDPPYRDVLRLLAVHPSLVCAGRRIAVSEPVAEAGHHLLPVLVEDWEGVAFGGCDGGVNAVEEPVEAGTLAALDVWLAEVDVDDLNAAYGAGSVLDDAQPSGEDFSPVHRGEPAVCTIDPAQLVPTGKHVAGV